MREPFVLAGSEVKAGTTRRVDLKVARLFTGDWLSLPVSVVHGARPGPNLWLSAAIHGDELNGMEIIRRVLAELDAKTMAGTVLAVPVVNVFGFVQGIRYLPDRRDLNRSFPGSKKGSLASRLAHLFINEVVSHCEYGIDLHTGSNHRTNLPQIRANLGNPEVRRLAEVFAAPMMYDAPVVARTLRSVTTKRRVKSLLFEGGEPLRLDAEVIEMGRRGVLRVLRELGFWSGTYRNEKYCEK